MHFDRLSVKVMKKLLFIFFFFAVNSLNCQVKLVCEEYLVPDTNILLAGYKNLFIIKGQNKFKKYKVVSTNSEIIGYPKTNEIEIRCKSTTDTISIFQNDKLVFKKAYRVIPFPRLIPTIGEINDTSATIEEILSNPIITFGQLNTKIFENYEPNTKHFIYLFDENNLLIYETYCYSTIMTEELKLKVKDLKQNSHIKIESFHRHGTIKHKIYIE